MPIDLQDALYIGSHSDCIGLIVVAADSWLDTHYIPSLAWLTICSCIQTLALRSNRILHGLIECYPTQLMLQTLHKL